MTVRHTLSLIPALLLLASCDEVLKSAAGGGKGGSIANEVRIASDSKPEIVAAFEAISHATTRGGAATRHPRCPTPARELGSATRA